ncbi:MAG: nitrate transporter permease [Enterovirga sp.]|nr:nitrate transporter permease [Enterovirga sp.]
MTRNRAIVLARIGVVAGAVVLVEVLCRLGVINPLTLVAPSRMVFDLAGILASGDINRDIAYTATTIATALVLSVVLGIVLGVAVHALPRVRRALDPLLASYYSVPSFIFYPLFVAIFGLNTFPLIVLGMAFAVPAMMMSTMAGLDRIPRVLLKTARVHRLNRWETATRIVLPSATPYLFTGLKLAIAYAFIGVIAGEFIMASAGLGHSIAFAYEGFDNHTMYALMLFVLVVVTVMNMSLHAWEGRLMRRRIRA